MRLCGRRRAESLTNGEIIGMRVCLVSGGGELPPCGLAVLRSGLRWPHMPSGGPETAVTPTGCPYLPPSPARRQLTTGRRPPPQPRRSRPAAETTGASHFSGPGGGDFPEGGGRLGPAQEEARQDEKWCNYRVGQRTHRVCHNLEEGPSRRPARSTRSLCTRGGEEGTRTPNVRPETVTHMWLYGLSVRWDVLEKINEIVKMCIDLS